jgi:hypothetical protein
MKRTWIYIGTGIGVMSATLLVLVLANKKKGSTTDNKEGDTEPQEKPDPKLQAAIITSSAIGKKLYTKVDEAKIRTSSAVNNGIMNNIYDTVPKANTYLGTVARVIVGDTKIINPATQKPYVWISFNLDKTLYNNLQKLRSWWDTDLWENMPPANHTWIREDVIKL